jgi:hypothetical protein
MLSEEVEQPPTTPSVSTPASATSSSNYRKKTPSPRKEAYIAFASACNSFKEQNQQQAQVLVSSDRWDTFGKERWIVLICPYKILFSGAHIVHKMRAIYNQSKTSALRVEQRVYQMNAEEEIQVSID